MTNLTIASNMSDVEIEQARARNRVDWASRELMANMLRISRGAGRTAALGQQLVEMLNAIQEFRDLHKFWPMAEIAEFIAFNRFDDDLSRFGDDANGRLERDLAHAQRTMTRGVFQHVASSLLGQRTHIATSSREIWEGGREFEAAYERLREARKAEKVRPARGRPKPR